MEINKFELNRQVFHILFGLLIAVLLVYDAIDKNIIIILIILGFILSYLNTKFKVPIINIFLQKFERKEEMRKFPGKGMIFYLIGTYIALILFPKEVALASIMVLALGDSISHIYGVHYGKIKHPFSKKGQRKVLRNRWLLLFQVAKIYKNLLENKES